MSNAKGNGPAPEWVSTPSPSSSGIASSDIPLANLAFKRRSDSPPIVDRYGDYKTDSQLYFTEEFHNSREWSLWMTMVFIILSWNGLPITTQRLPYLSIHSVRCKIPDLENTNWSFSQIHKISSYSNASGHCYYYDYDYKLLSFMPFTEALNLTQNSPKPLIKKCSKYTTNAQEDGYTHMNEFHIECISEDKKNFAIINSGLLIGFLITGFLADIYGRKWTLIGTHFVVVIGNILTATSPTFLFMIVTLTISKSASECLDNISWILLLETVHYKMRVYATVAIRIGYSAGCFLHVLLFYYIRYWRYYQWAVTCTSLLPVFTVWLLPESPHWLICNKRWQQMVEVLNEMNYPKFTQFDMETYRNSEPPQVSSITKITKVLVKPIFFKKLILGLLLYSLIKVLFHAENRRIFNALDSEPIFFVIIGFSLLINIIVIPLMLKRMSRPMMICICLLLLALFYCSYTIYQPYPVAAVSISCLCSTVIQMITIVNRLLIIEMFPTKVRATALSICRSSGVLLSIILDVIEIYTNVEKKLITSYIWTVYGATVLVIAVVYIFVRETGNVPLPDTELQAILHF